MLNNRMRNSIFFILTAITIITVVGATNYQDCSIYGNCPKIATATSSSCTCTGGNSTGVNNPFDQSLNTTDEVGFQRIYLLLTGVNDNIYFGNTTDTTASIGYIDGLNFDSNGFISMYSQTGEVSISGGGDSVNLTGADYINAGDDVCLISNGQCLSSINVGWQPDNLTEDRNYYTTGNVTANYGFFSYLGSLTSRITKGWFTDIDVSGTVNATNVTANNFIGNGSLLTGVRDGTGGWINNSIETNTSLNVNINDNANLNFKNKSQIIFREIGRAHV
jgi:hypothetical protein